MFDATRIGGVQTAGELIMDNLKVGEEFVRDHLGHSGRHAPHLGCPLRWK
ncbi:hypothetical protein [Kribbella antiqua]|nr:hypothetical protein [Kribbella antiqua]